MCNFAFGCICGALLVCAAAIFLLWNEGRAVRRAQILDEALSLCHPLASNEVVFDTHNGHLVHLTGSLTTTEPLIDVQFGVSIWSARLRRTVEMYQWVEERRTTEHEEDGETRSVVTYHYTREWRKELVDSRFFDEQWLHKNPSTFPVGYKEWRAPQTTVGSFHLSPALIELLSDWKPVQLSVNQEMEREGVDIYNNFIYYSRNPWSPDVGDVRIRYDYAGLSDAANPSHVSIIACQSPGGELTAYFSPDMGEELLLLHYGIESHEEMLSKEHTSNMITTWVYRGIGWCGSFVGFLIITNIGRFLEDFPVLREILNCGLLMASLSLASSVTLVSIAIGWLRHRPLIAIALFSAAAVPYMVTKQRAGNLRSNQ